VITTHGCSGRAVRIGGGRRTFAIYWRLVVFLQVLRIIAQAAIFFAMYISPAWYRYWHRWRRIIGLWILVNFLAAAFDCRPFGQRPLGVVLDVLWRLSRFGDEACFFSFVGHLLPKECFLMYDVNAIAAISRSCP